MARRRFASSGASFVSGFESGQRIASNALSAYQAGKDAADQSEVRSALAGLEDAPAATGTATEGTKGDSADVAKALQIEPMQNVPGLGMTTDPAYAKSMAEDQSFITGEDVTPQPAYKVGSNVYNDQADAVAAQKDAATEPGGLPAGLSDARATQDHAKMFREIAVPRVINTYLKQGRLTEAKRFADFIDSQEGQHYTNQWASGMRMHALGDNAGALNQFQQIYNRQLYNDGHVVKLTPLEDGKNFRADFYAADNSGNLVHSRTRPISEMVQQAAMALEPSKLVEFQAKGQQAKEHEGALLDRSIQLEGLRQQGRDQQDDRRDERLGVRLDANANALDTRLAASSDALGTRIDAAAARAANRNPLTLTQESANLAVDAARKRIEGLSQDDIRKRTAKTTNTGRENPLYDDQLARSVSLASRRKVGADDWFDANRAQPPGAAPGAAPAAAPAAANEVFSRFQTDPQMRGMKLGAQTQQGAEVRDANGKLLGYYR
jgi:hypothetical protein